MSWLPQSRLNPPADAPELKNKKAEKDPNNSYAWHTVAVITALIRFAVLSMAFRDWWLWFAVPLGVHPITFWHAAGLMEARALFWKLRAPPEAEFGIVKTTAEYDTTIAFSTTVIYLIVWGAAWAIHRWGM